MEVEEQLKLVQIPKHNFQGHYNTKSFQHSLKQPKILERAHSSIRIAEINDYLQSDDTKSIKNGLNILSNQHQSNIRDQFQGVAHLFIPQLLKIIAGLNYEKLSIDIIKYLQEVSSVERLTPECVEIFKQIGAIIIVKKIERSIYFRQFIKLARKLCIISRILMDKFISVGIVDALFQIIQKKQWNTIKFYAAKSEVQTAGLVLDTLLILHSESPPFDQESAEKVVYLALSSVKYIAFWRQQFKKYCRIIQEAQQLAQRIYNFKDEEQCCKLLKILYKIFEFQTKKMQKNIAQLFRPIFMKIYIFYYQKYKEAELPPNLRCLLYGSVFVGQKQLLQYIQKAIFNLYTPQMYAQFFRSTIKQKTRPLITSFKVPVIRAFEIINNDEDIELALEFICWIFSYFPIRKCQHEPQLYRNKQQQISVLTKDQQKFMINILLKRLESSYTILFALKHSPNKNVSELAKLILKTKSKNKKKFHVFIEFE